MLVNIPSSEVEKWTAATVASNVAEIVSKIADEINRIAPESQYREGLRDGLSRAVRIVERHTAGVCHEPTGKITNWSRSKGLGRYIGGLIEEMLKEARKTGNTIRAPFNDSVVEVLPTDTADFAYYRWNNELRISRLKEGFLTVAEF